MSSLRERLKERRAAEAIVMTEPPAPLRWAEFVPEFDVRTVSGPTRFKRRPPGGPVADIIDALCHRQNWAMDDLAVRIGVHYSFISRIRSGERRPSLDVVLLMVERWPLTETERVELCTHFQVIPPGYRIVPTGEWALAAAAAGG